MVSVKSYGQFSVLVSVLRLNQKEHYVPQSAITPRKVTLLLGCDSKFRCAYFYAGCGGLFLPTLLFLSAGVYFW